MARRPIHRTELLILAAASIAVFTVELFRIGIPSFWYDEAATYSGASRSFPSLWAMLGNVDAVHGLYYVLQHPVVHLFGPDPIAMRASSSLAVALTAAALYVLTRQFGPPLSALAASTVWLGLARTSWMATEARSFALATLTATVLTLILCAAVRSRSRRWVVGYIVVALFGTHLYIYILLVVFSHALTVLWSRCSRQRKLVLWSAMGLVTVLSAPLVTVIASQRGQLGGTFPISVGTWSHVFVSEFFHRAVWQSVAAWSMLAVAATIIVVRTIALRGSTRRLAERSSATEQPGLLATLLPWLVLPTVAIVVFSTVSPTIYQPRALVFCAPAFCVLLAESLRRALGSWAALTAAVLVVALGIPAFISNRELTAKGSDWPLVASELTNVASAGDGILYSEPIDYHSWPSLVRIMHPDAVVDLVDVTLSRPYDEVSELFDDRVDVDSRSDELSDLDRVWYVHPGRLTRAQTDGDVSVLQDSGLTLVSTWTGPRTVIEEWIRSSD